MVTHRGSTLLAACFLVALGIAAAWAALAVGVGGPDAPLAGDEVEYVGIARNLASGNGYSRDGAPTTTRAPAMVFYLAPAFLAGEPSRSLLRWYAAVPKILLPFIAFLIWRRTGFRTRHATLLAVPFGIYPLIVWNTGLLLSEALLPILLLPWFALVVTTAHRTLKDSIIAALLGGLVVLTRFPLLPAVMIFPPAYMLARSRMCPGRERRAALLRIATYLVVVCLVYLPWPVRNFQTFGVAIATSSKAGVDLWKSNNPSATGVMWLDHGGTFNQYRETIRDLPEVEQERVARAAAIKFMRDHPGRLVQLAAKRQAEFWKPFSKNIRVAENVVAGGPYVLLLLSFIVLLIGMRRRPEAAPFLWGALGFSLLVAGPFLVYPAIVRYRLAAEVAMLWAVLYVVAATGLGEGCARVDLKRLVSGRA